MLKRHILLLMLFFLVIVNTLVTMSINIAIVSMVNFHEDSIVSNDISCPNTTLFLRDFLDTGNDEEISLDTEIIYNWSKEERNMALAGYYWLNYISILPAGILAYKYGPKRVAGYGQLIASCMSSLIPILADYGPAVVAWIRAVQGVLSFMAVPAGLYTIVGNWCPPQERGIFGSSVVAGSGFSLSMGSILFGYIARYIHWHYVFHVTTVFGIIWAVLWYMLIYEHPREHPTISDEEKKYLESSMKTFEESEKSSIPWKNIMTSIPFIICALASNSTIWVFVAFITYSPIFLKSTYGLNSNEIGIINCISLFSNTVLSLVLGWLSDVLIKRRILTLRKSRIIFTLLGNIIATIPLIVMAFVKCDVNVIIACIFLMISLRAACMYGASFGVLDLSPKFGGILEGICGTSGSIQAFIFSTIISYYSSILSSEDLWKYVFILTASYTILANGLYMIFGSSEVQWWSFEKPVQA